MLISINLPEHCLFSLFVDEKCVAIQPIISRPLKSYTNSNSSVQWQADGHTELLHNSKSHNNLHELLCCSLPLISLTNTSHPASSPVERGRKQTLTREKCTADSSLHARWLISWSAVAVKLHVKRACKYHGCSWMLVWWHTAPEQLCLHSFSALHL